MDQLSVGGVSVPVLGLGTYSMEGERLRLAVNTALGVGYTWFDTAYRYKNERELGKALRCVDSQRGWVSSKLSGLQYVGERKWWYLNRVSAKKALKGSLKRLDVRQLDMYMLHSPFNHYEKAYAELIALRETGLVRLSGVSGFDENQLKHIKQFCGEYPQFNMVECHPHFSNKGLIAFCRENGVQVIARSPFAHGLILPVLGKDEGLSAMSKRYDKSVPQLVLKWMVQQGLAVVVRSCDPNHIRENIDIFDFELAEGEMEYIDGLNLDQSYGVR